MSVRRPRDAWRDQAGHEPTRTGSSGPDMWPDPTCPHKAEARRARRSGGR